MKDKIKPNEITQGEHPRLFSILSDSSKENRTMSAFLSCLIRVPELAQILFKSIDQRVGKTSKIEGYVEVVPSKKIDSKELRPDGFIILRVGKREWKALFEVKVGKQQLDPTQIENYRKLVKTNGFDCLITISNQFTSSPKNHPMEEVRKSSQKSPVFHWSWMYVLTSVELLISDQNFTKNNSEKAFLLNELRRFLAHESSGVKGFDRMPKEWSELVRHIRAGGDVNSKPNETKIVLEAWQQEVRDLSLIMSRLVQTPVSLKFPRNEHNDYELRLKSEIKTLQNSRQLKTTLIIPRAAVPIDVVVDLSMRTVAVGMILNSPGDKKTARAKINWLIRQIKTNELDNLHLSIRWENIKIPTQKEYLELIKDIDLVIQEKKNKTPKTFHLFESHELGQKFNQPSTFIKFLEEIVPKFYKNIGQHIVGWSKPAPKILENKSEPSDVTPESISDVAESFLIDKN